jgi:nitrite reductase (NO-forming)
LIISLTRSSQALVAKSFVALGTGALLALVTAACVGAPSAPSRSQPVNEVTVTATDFHLEPSVITVPANERIRLTFNNNGLLEHDWEARGMRAEDIRIVSTTPALSPTMRRMSEDRTWDGIPHPMAPAGGQMVMEFTPAQAGSYEVICQVPGHKEAGMVASLIVTDGSIPAELRGSSEPGVTAAPTAVFRPAANAVQMAQPEVQQPLGPGAPTLRHFDVETTEVIGLIDDGVEYRYWTFGGTVPGPMIRVRQGDTVELTLRNAADSSVTHSIDLHAVTGPGGGAVATQVVPGESATFRFQALKPGVYVYHCATPIAPVHIANGMYGLIVVEPPEGLPTVDRELYVMQGDFYLDGGRGIRGLQGFSMEKMLDERPDYVLLNGAMGARSGDRAFRANTGETIRIFFGVGGPNLHSSFHLIGEIFDEIHPEGASETLSNVQTTMVPAGGATMVELTVEVPGTYTLVDHSLGRVVKGAAATLQVQGSENLEFFAPSRSAAELSHAGH